ncbi:MAG: hypothetical protein IJ856_02560 [Candidatus Methanomethylophilaceae archaeon]|nr:hypothetical protein [Candidatus Methanomethylophilaceae archaeon]
MSGASAGNEVPVDLLPTDKTDPLPYNRIYVIRTMSKIVDCRFSVVIVLRFDIRWIDPVAWMCGDLRMDDGSAHDYLERGERNTNLAKNHYESIRKSFDSDKARSMWEKKLPIDSIHDLFPLLTSGGSFFRPILKEAFTKNDPSGTRTIDSLNDLLNGCGMKITGLRRYRGPLQVQNLVGSDNTDMLIEMDLQDERTSEIRTIIGSKAYSHRVERKGVLSWHYRKTSENIGFSADPRTVLMFLFMMKEVRTRLGLISVMPENGRVGDALYSNALNFLSRLRSIGVEEDFITTTIPDLNIDWNKILFKRILIDSKAKGNPNAVVSRKMFEAIGIEVKEIEVRDGEYRDCASGERYEPYSSFLIGEEYPVLLRSVEDYPAAGLLPYFLGLSELRSLHDYSGKMPFICEFSFPINIIQEIVRPFVFIYKEKHEQVLEIRDLNQSDKEYARSFQTKKDIPEKVLKAMSESILNEVFGYIEYYVDCDLTKIHGMEQEVIGFITAFLPNLDASEYCLRFRALGNHHASGLYYPTYNCMCVDYRDVTSFVHELGHLIDYKYGNLSWDLRFTRIRDLYTKALMRRGGRDAFNNSSKYNLEYYLKPTEIFARSMEIYFFEIKGIRSALLPERLEGVQYPIWDSVFMDEVRSYFTNFFDTVQNDRVGFGG